MKTRLPGILAALMMTAAMGCGGISVGAGGSSGGVGIGAGFNPNLYEQEIEDWHQARIGRLKAPDGWLALVGLFELPEGTHTFGSAPDNELVFPAGSTEHGGVLAVKDSVVTLTKGKGVKMTADKERIRGPIVLRSDTNPQGPTKVQMGAIQFYVIERPGGLFLRVKDANSPVRKNFKGIERFPVSKEWRFDAVLERYDPPRLVKVPNIMGYEEMVPCPGALVFQKDGMTYRLEANSQEGDELFIVFGDGSSGQDTYGGGRFVYVAMPGADGHTTLDFNRAYNPPCVFTEFATCPLPTPGNILPFRVEAGEKAWGDAHR
ncbi:MAG TPA: DUF1684 domain-containing protein [Candidatus Krumholzibacteria bacterium]